MYQLRLEKDNQFMLKLILLQDTMMLNKFQKMHILKPTTKLKIDISKVQDNQ